MTFCHLMYFKSCKFQAIHDIKLGKVVKNIAEQENENNEIIVGKVFCKSEELWSTLKEMNAEDLEYDDLMRYLDCVKLLSLVPNAANYEPNLVLYLENVLEEIQQMYSTKGMLEIQCQLVELQLLNHMGFVFTLNRIYGKAFSDEAKIVIDQAQMVYDRLFSETDENKTTILTWMEMRDKDFYQELHAQLLALIRNKFFYYSTIHSMPKKEKSLKLIQTGIDLLQHMAKHDELHSNTFLLFTNCAFEVADTCIMMNQFAQAQYILSVNVKAFKKFKEIDGNMIKCPFTVENIKSSILYCKMLYVRLLVRLSRHFCGIDRILHGINDKVMRIEEVDIAEPKEIHVRPLKDLDEVTEVLEDAEDIFYCAIQKYQQDPVDKNVQSTKNLLYHMIFRVRDLRKKDKNEEISY